MEEEEERQIKELWTRASDYICTGNWKKYKECWSHSPQIQLIHPDEGEWLKGWKKIESKYEKMLNSGFKCSILSNELELNVSPSGDMAWGTVDIILNFNDTAQTRLRLWETLIFEKINGEWKIVHGMASIPKNLNE